MHVVRFILILVWLSASAAMASAQVSDMGSLIDTYRHLKNVQEKDDPNLVRAEALDRQSREAMDRGNPELAAKLLKEAIDMLKLKGPSPGKPADLREAILSVSDASTVVKTLPYSDDAASMRSPFGIFGPYQFVLDSREIMNHEKINGYLTDLGVKWVQEMPMGIKFVPDFINIYSRVGREGGSKPPNIDYETYKRALRQSIRENKGRVKYWEVDSEPGGLSPPMGWKGHEKGYADFLKETYLVIKGECPDCLVVMGGAGGIAGGKRGDLNSAFVQKILDYGAGEYFDVFSFKLHHHKLSDYVDLKNKLEIYRNIFSEHHIDLKKKMIFLETAIYDGDPHYAAGHPLSFITLPPQTEFQQASGLVRSYIFAIAQGVDKIFWNEVFERYHFGGAQRNPFNYYGLVNNPLNDDGRSHKKLAYYAYKKMVEVLEGSDWKNMVKVKEDGGIFIYRLDRQGKTTTIAWNDGDVESGVVVTGLKTPHVKVTNAVPIMNSGMEVVDYVMSFKERIVETEENGVRLMLGFNPVYIEAYNKQ